MDLYLHFVESICGAVHRDDKGGIKHDQKVSSFSGKFIFRVHHFLQEHQRLKAYLALSTSYILCSTHSPCTADIVGSSVL